MAEKPTPKDDGSNAAGQDPAGQKMARANVAEVESVENTKPAEVTQDGAILVQIADAGALDTVIESAGADEFVTLTADVVEQYRYPNTQRPAHRLAYTKGQVVRRSEIEARRADLTPVEGIAGYLDSSTLASGSYKDPAAS